MCDIKKTLWICMICIPILKDMDNSLILKVIHLVVKKSHVSDSTPSILRVKMVYYKQIQINKRGKSIAKKEWTVALKYKKK